MIVSKAIKTEFQPKTEPEQQESLPRLCVKCAMNSLQDLSVIVPVDESKQRDDQGKPRGGLYGPEGVLDRDLVR